MTLQDTTTTLRYVTSLQDAIADQPAVITWATAYAALDHRRGLLITGPPGSGKTYQAHGAANLAAAIGDQTLTVEATSYADLAAANLDRCRHADVLIVDHLDQDHRPTRRTLIDLIEDRYDNSRPTIVTTDLRPVHLGFIHGDLLAATILSTCDLADLTKQTETNR